MVSSSKFGFAIKEFFPTSWLLAQLDTLFIGVLKDIVSKPILDEDLQQLDLICVSKMVTNAVNQIYLAKNETNGNDDHFQI